MIMRSLVKGKPNILQFVAVPKYACEMRPEIEEDCRQLKNFWNLEDFKSTKLCLITFHIICVLLGCLMFNHEANKIFVKKF